MPLISAAVNRIAQLFGPQAPSVAPPDRFCARLEVLQADTAPDCRTPTPFRN